MVLLIKTVPLVQMAILLHLEIAYLTAAVINIGIMTPFLANLAILVVKLVKLEIHTVVIAVHLK